MTQCLFYDSLHLKEINIFLPSADHRQKLKAVNLGDVYDFLNGRETKKNHDQSRAALLNWLDRLAIERIATYELYNKIGNKHPGAT